MARNIQNAVLILVINLLIIFMQISVGLADHDQDHNGVDLDDHKDHDDHNGVDHDDHDDHDDKKGGGGGVISGSFAPGLATWYGPPNGPGSGGACGLDTDVAQPPYSGMIAAGNAKIYLSGHGCGQCYQVQCTAPKCSGQPIDITITDECPGACNNVPFHFDLSGLAFGKMAKPGEEENLRQLGQVDIQFKRVPCNYKGANIAFKLDKNINPYYFACAVESINGDGDIGSMELKSAGSPQWIPMSQSWGATWKADVNPSVKGPLSFKITTSTGKSFVVDNGVPANFAAGTKYVSNFNI